MEDIKIDDPKRIKSIDNLLYSKIFNEPVTPGANDLSPTNSESSQVMGSVHSRMTFSMA